MAGQERTAGHNTPKGWNLINLPDRKWNGRRATMVEHVIPVEGKPASPSALSITVVDRSLHGAR